MKIEMLMQKKTLRQGDVTRWPWSAMLEIRDTADTTGLRRPIRLNASQRKALEPLRVLETSEVI